MEKKIASRRSTRGDRRSSLLLVPRYPGRCTDIYEAKRFDVALVSPSSPFEELIL